MNARFGHAGIVVRDLDAQIRFYTRVFGLELETRFEREGPFIDNMTGLRGARVEIAILGNADRRSAIELLNYVSHPDGSPERPANAMNASHVMFEVDDVEQAASEVIAAGGVPMCEPQTTPDGAKTALYFRDPEGTLLELLRFND